MSLRIRTIPLVLAMGLGSGAYCQKPARDPSLDLFFDSSRPAVRQLYLPGTRVLKHLDTIAFHQRLLEEQRASGGILYTASQLDSPRWNKFDPALREAVRDGRYGDAHRFSDDGRIALVKSFYPALRPDDGQWARAAMQAATDFIAGRDSHAVLRASYALSLNPVAPGLAGFLRGLEKATGKSGTRIPSGTGLSLLEVKLNATKDLFKAKRYESMVRLCREVLVLKPGDPTALARLGSGFYMRGEFKKAAAVWKAALSGEQRPGERTSLAAMIKRANIASRPKPVQKPEKPAVDPEAVETLYKTGVAAHAEGDFQSAKTAFEQMASLVPEDKRAEKALRRLRVENGK